MSDLTKAIKDYQSTFIDSPTVTQKFGAKTFGFYGQGGHEGTDYRASTGSNLYGLKGWRVTYAGQGESYYGNKIILQNPETGESLEFAHLNDVNVKKGDIIPADKYIIGHTGNTGNRPDGKAQQSHLHVNYYTADGKKADVTKLASNIEAKAPSGFPVPAISSLFSKVVKPAYAAEGTTPTSQKFDKYGNLILNKNLPLRNENVLPQGTTPTVETGSEYVVQKGDSLSKIAKQYGTTWQNIANANPNISNPNLIYSGNKIVIPAVGQQKTNSGNGYLIKSGDTLSQIAKKLGTTVGTLMTKNNIPDANKIYSGDVIKY